MLHIKTASGGELEVFMRRIEGRLSAEGLPIYAVLFGLTVPVNRDRHWRATLETWVSGTLETKSSLIRRRAARSLIAFGLATADGVEHHDLLPTTKPKPTGACEMLYTSSVLIGGLERTAIITATLDSQPNRSKLDPTIPAQASQTMRRLARELHGAIDLSGNAEIFGAAI